MQRQTNAILHALRWYVFLTFYCSWFEASEIGGWGSVGKKFEMGGMVTGIRT